MGDVVVVANESFSRGGLREDGRSGFTAGHFYTVDDHAYAEDIEAERLTVVTPDNEAQYEPPTVDEVVALNEGAQATSSVHEVPADDLSERVSEKEESNQSSSG